jgi:hypothetical protein
MRSFISSFFLELFLLEWHLNNAIEKKLVCKSLIGYSPLLLATRILQAQKKASISSLVFFLDLKCVHVLII